MCKYSIRVNNVELMSITEDFMVIISLEKVLNNSDFIENPLEYSLKEKCSK